MDSIGDYFYLIVLAIAGLSGLLKKKKQTPNMNPTPTAPRRSWEDVLRELVPVDEMKVEEVKVKKAVIPKAKTVEPILVVNFNNEGVSSLRTTKQVSQLISQNKNTEEETYIPNNILQEIQFNSTHEARKAFIYSEIFNRKY